MQTINTTPVTADFNNRDSDGAVRLHLPVTQRDLARQQIHLDEGQYVWVTDNEMEMIGRVTLRDGIWVAVPDTNGFKNVAPDAPHHISNLK